MSSVTKRNARQSSTYPDLRPEFVALAREAQRKFLIAKKQGSMFVNITLPTDGSTPLVATSRPGVNKAS